MDQPIFINKLAFNLLLSNLLEIEEDIDGIIADFFFEPSKEAEDARRFLNEYVKRLDNMIRNITTVETAGDDFPYAIVGSEVTVKDLDSGLIYCYKLVSPCKNKIDSNDISFLSPMGKVLLLRKVHDIFTVEAPGGSYKYKVLAVRIFTGIKRSNSNFTYIEGER